MARQKKTGIIAEVRKGREKKGHEKSKVTAKERMHKLRQRRPKGSRYAV
jgi:hypothetical protein